MICLTCRREIPPERLRAVPDAEYCVACQPSKPLVLTALIIEALAESEIEPGQVWPRSR